MKTRTFVLALAFSAASLAVEAKPFFRVELRDGTALLASDQPVRHGTVLVFHRRAGGLTGVPIEAVRRITPQGFRGAAVSQTTGPLRPGDAIDLGVTAATPPPAGGAVAGATAAPPSGDGSLSYTTLGSGQTGYVQTPNGLVPVGPAGVVTPIGPSGLPTALSGPPPSTDINGMPLVPAGEPPTAGGGATVSPGGAVIVPSTANTAGQSTTAGSANAPASGQPSSTTGAAPAASGKTVAPNNVAPNNNVARKNGNGTNQAPPPNQAPANSGAAPNGGAPKS